MGSLLAATASFLDARANHGAWLVRIEDIDPPREVPGADARILATLLDHGLEWDEAVLYQHQRHSAYEAAITRLIQSGHAYYCTCSRQDFKLSGGRHKNNCPRSASPPLAAASIRLREQHGDMTFIDILRGRVEPVDFPDNEDLVLRRRDGLYAYQLAVVVDDAYQRITHVVRGNDLLTSTPRQISLARLLGLRPPEFAHLPLLLNASGQKLSKQNQAPAVDASRATSNLLSCLKALGQQLPPPEVRNDCSAILQWASQHWQRERIPLMDREP
jgi:glutamyl-Q tRNA(Asp) synthetase